MSSILFLDIETASEYPTFKDLPEDGKVSFMKKFGYILETGIETDIEVVYEKNAALHAEYSKIICMSLGVVLAATADRPEQLYVKGITGRETDILKAFKDTLEKMKPTHLCAHRGKTFDMPFMGRRMLINGIALPEILNVGDMKPWEVKWLDTSEMWQFSDKKYYVSLVALAYVFKIPSPKQDLDGSQVGAAYRAGHIAKIKDYCNGDTLTLMKIYRKLNQLPEITATSMV
jgi:DNA polymerase elongation subunit (family B)